MKIMLFNLAFTLLTTVFSANIIANEKYIFQKVLQLFRQFITPLITLPVLLLGYKSISMVIVTTSVNVAIIITNIIFCYRKLGFKFNFKRLETKLVKRMLVFSSYVFMDLIVTQINWSVDKYILGRMIGTTSVAVYSIAGDLNRIYISMSTAILQYSTTNT